MIEKVEEALDILTNLKENTSKQPFFSPPSLTKVLEQISEFMEKDLDTLISLLTKVYEAMEEPE